MSKLYVFAIGGTGSRVLRSLTMLLSTGVDCGIDTIVPIVIDRDVSNRDYTRTQELIQDYIAVHEMAAKTGENKFFKTKIELLNNKLCLQLYDNTEKFDDFIGKGTLSRENNALIEMLFSKKTLNLDMTAGFQGNPNIGSVVLNQFDDSDVFKAFANNFQDGDKIFIISSIFGGTGASGFPLLQKTLHTPNLRDSQNKALSNWGLVNKAPMGAITVLPYFNVKSATDGSLVNSDTFIDKTKAALSYYKNLDKNLDVLYYIADSNPTSYDHHKGGDKQRNNAHFIELASAISILDFINPLKTSINFNRDTQGNIIQTIYKEFAINSNNDSGKGLNLNNLSDETKKLIITPFTRFALFSKYMGFLAIEKNVNGKTFKKIEETDSIFNKQYKHQPYSKINSWNKKIVENDNIKKLKNVQEKYLSWLLEMEEQSRMFTPYNLENKSAFDFVRGEINIVNPSKWNDMLFSNWAKVDNELNRQIHNVDKSFTEEEQFIELFFRTTKALIK